MYLKKTHVNISCLVPTCGRLFLTPPCPISHTLLAFTSLRNPLSPALWLTVFSRCNASKQDLSGSVLIYSFPISISLLFFFLFTDYWTLPPRTFWKKPKPQGLAQGLSTTAPANGTGAPSCEHMRAPSWKWLLPTTLLDRLSQKTWCVAETRLLHRTSLELQSQEQINACYFWSHRCWGAWTQSDGWITGTPQSHSEACFLLLGLGIIPNGALHTASMHFCLRSCCFREQQLNSFPIPPLP